MNLIFEEQVDDFMNEAASKEDDYEDWLKWATTIKNNRTCISLENPRTWRYHLCSNWKMPIMGNKVPRLNLTLSMKENGSRSNN
jgi:hypothetical protein